MLTDRDRYRDREYRAEMEICEVYNTSTPVRCGSHRRYFNRVIKIRCIK